MRGVLQSLTLVFLVLATNRVRSARRVDANVHLHDVLYKRKLQMADMTSDMPSRQRRASTSLPIAELDKLMSLGPNSALEVTRSATTVQGRHLLRLQETFKGEPVDDAVITVSTDSKEQHVYDASGVVYKNIEKDTNGKRNVASQRALDICLTWNNDAAIKDTICGVKIEPKIFLDKQNHAYPGYLVQYLVLVESEKRRPSCIVDARDGRVTMSWDALDSYNGCVGKGTGGNRKIGKIHYGKFYPCLEVRRVNNTCYTENQYVKVIDNKGILIKNETQYYNLRDAASYDCEEATDEINGAYSPILDALFYGTTVVRMFKDWYSTTPLEGQLTIRVHVGVNYSNAFWDGRDLQFGDGDKDHYPFVSLDIMGHEIGHGLTEKASNLMYYNQWGAINEAFSDMMGETSEAYLWKVDWLAGFDITKKELPMRYFGNPSADHHSISHVDNFTDDLDVHLGSGVYNRVFYLLVHDYEQSIKEIFRVFLHANRMYWHHMSDYRSAACDVMKAAYDLGQDGALFRRAFKEVGIEVCDTQKHVVGLRGSQVYNGIRVARNVSPVFLYMFPAKSPFRKLSGVKVSAKSDTGDVHIALTNKSWDFDNQDPEILAEGNNLVTAEIKSNLTALPVYILLGNKLKVDLTDVTLQVNAF